MNYKMDNYKIINKSNSDITINITFTDIIKNNVIKYISANPAERRTSFTGSGLPFFNKDQAFENTTNKGTMNIVNQTCKIDLKLPNSYMNFDIKIPPTLYINYETIDGKMKDIEIILSEGIPFRSLGYPKNRKDANFYNTQFTLPVRNQEEILINSAYPKINHMPKDFWGLKPCK